MYIYTHALRHMSPSDKGRQNRYLEEREEREEREEQEEEGGTWRRGRRSAGRCAAIGHVYIPKYIENKLALILS
jgi:hypothetical protein